MLHNSLEHAVLNNLIVVLFISGTFLYINHIYLYKKVIIRNLIFNNIENENGGIGDSMGRDTSEHNCSDVLP